MTVQYAKRRATDAGAAGATAAVEPHTALLSDAHGLYRRYAVASVGLMAIATANGIVRETTYGGSLGSDTAGLVSLVPMTALFAGYVYWLERRIPLPTWRSAVAVGGMWAGIAAGFELSVGHYVDGKSWSELLAAYDITRGRSGGLVLAVTVALPAAVRLARRRLGRS